MWFDKNGAGVRNSEDNKNLKLRSGDQYMEKEVNIGLCGAVVSRVNELWTLVGTGVDKLQQK